MGETAMLHFDLEALIGSTIHGRYEVETLLGVGGMGAVFRGRHTGLQRGVAIKVLHPEIGRDPSVAKRFDREAQSASRLDHPNCVRVTDFGTTENGTKYLVMELLEGGDLERRLGQPWPPDRAIATIEQVLYGLEHAHHVGIVHRDLKPENIFVTKDFRGEEVVKIVDFGIAKLIDEKGSEKLTRQGIVFGTPRYMAPEQAAGGKIDERTDLYAVGLIFYELLAGHPPFQSDDAAQLLRMQIMAPPQPLPASVPAPLIEIVEKLIEKSKNDRFASAREVLDALALAKGALALAGAALSGSGSAGLVASASAASSGVAWRPAPEHSSAISPAISGATLAGSTIDLAAVSMPAASVSMSSGSGSGSAGYPSTSQMGMSVAGVEAQQPAPPHARRWLPIALAGGTLGLVLFGAVVLVASLDSETEPSASERAEQAELPTAVVGSDAAPSTAAGPSSNAAPSSDAPPASKPAPNGAAPTPSLPSRADSKPSKTPDAKPKTKPDQKPSGPDSAADTHSKTDPSNDKSGGSTDTTVVPQDSTVDPTHDPAGGVVDPNKAKPDSEADAEQRKREQEEREAQRDAEKNREQGSGQGKGKGHDKKKDD